MRPVQILLTLTAIAGWAAPAESSQAIPGEMYVVINNTSDDQLCSAKAPGGNWSPWFTLGHGANWTFQHSSRPIKFQCRPPVQHVKYSLEPGKRYNLLRDDDGNVSLVEVTAEASAPPHN